MFLKSTTGETVLSSSASACPRRGTRETRPVRDLVAMLSWLRLDAGSKHAPGAFGSATWQAGASLDRGTKQTSKRESELFSAAYKIAKV